jgi:hypothetical protein
MPLLDHKITCACSTTERKQHMATTSSIANLKLTAAKKSQHLSPIVQRRYKMSRRIWEQIELARCQAAGTHYAPTKFRTVKDAETGVRRQVEVPKRIKSWVFTTDGGKTAIAVRYGARVLELAKGKFAVEVPSPAQLIPTLELIKTAIDAGELDEQLEATAGSVKAAFKRSSGS